MDILTYVRTFLLEAQCAHMCDISCLSGIHCTVTHNTWQMSVLPSNGECVAEHWLSADVFSCCFFFSMSWGELHVVLVCLPAGTRAELQPWLESSRYVHTYVRMWCLCSSPMHVCVCACVRAYACMMVWLSSLVLPAYLCKQTTFTFVIRAHVDTQM